MSSDHVHNWYLIRSPEVPDDEETTPLSVERCSWCGERREYRDSGIYDR